MQVENGIKPFEKQFNQYLFPDDYRLLPGTSQIYELQLAVEESRVMTDEELIQRGAYFHQIGNQDTKHFKLCSVSPLQVDDQSSARRKSFFEANLFKTGYATHGLFPYRGKFHPQMIKAIMNIIGLKPGHTVLDPMMGSGTICTEASINGIYSIGVDASPFCCLMAKAKTKSLNFEGKKILDLLDRAESIFDHLDGNGQLVQRSLFDIDKHEPDEQRKEDLFDNEDFEDFALLAYLDAMGYAKRRKNKTPRELFPVVLTRYVSAAGTFAKIREKLQLNVVPSKMVEGDARNLALIEDNSIDGIVTSPPYSFAIDYVENDAPQHEYLGTDVEALKDIMLGLRGGKELRGDKKLQMRYQCYLEDMDKVLEEITRVLKPNKYAVIVIGTNSNQIRRFVGETEDTSLDLEMTKRAQKHGLNLVADIIHPIEGIRNIMRDEHLLFYCKD